MGETMHGSPATQRAVDAENCPALIGNAIQRARLADGDAAEFAMLVRDEPADVVWGRVARWAAEHPQRFAAAFVHLAAMVDVDAPPATWTREIGGTAALHPDFRHKLPEPKIPPASRTPELNEQIVQLAKDGKLTDIKIATRFGLPVYYVTQVRRAAGLQRKNSKVARAANERDEEIARLTRLNRSAAEIALELGIDMRTVSRSRQRTRLREQRAAPGSDASAA